MNRYHAVWLRWSAPRIVLALTVWVLGALVAIQFTPAPWNGAVAGVALAVPISLALVAGVALLERRSRWIR